MKRVVVAGEAVEVGLVLGDVLLHNLVSGSVGNGYVLGVGFPWVMG